MGTIQERQALLELLVEHEKGMEEMYRQDALAFPSYGAFFLGLAEEEQCHAEAIVEVRNRLAEVVAGIDDRTFRIGALRTSLAFLKLQVEEGRKRRRSIVEALTIAVDFERSLIEKRFYEIFPGDMAGLRRLFGGLSQGTGQHIAKIQALRDQVAHGQAAPVR